MTNKEAIEHLKNINDRYPCSLDTTFRDECEMIAINLAIKALEEQRPQGKWLHPYITNIACECSNCNLQLPITDYFNFCPNCGAYMKGGTE